MNYSKLKLSFILLLIMAIIQFLTSLFILKHIVITLLSALAIILCLLAFFYIDSKAK